jgi:hypothetical protein
MPTANDIITRALENIITLDSHETPEPEDLNGGLDRLNSFIGSLNAQPQTMYVPTTITKALTIAKVSYTIGSGGDIDTTLPVKIRSAFVREASGVDFPMKVTMNYKDYDRINDKDIPGYPRKMYFERSYPTATIYMWPVADQALTLHMKVWSPIPTFTNLTTSMSLPLEYEDMLIYNLSLRLAPKYPDARVTPLLAGLAKDSMDRVKSMNLQPIEEATRLPFQNRNTYDIRSDGDLLN